MLKVQHKASHVKIYDCPQALADLYEEGYQFANFFMHLMLTMRQEPYSFRGADKGLGRVISQDEIEADLASIFGEKLNAASKQALRTFAIGVFQRDGDKSFKESDSCSAAMFRAGNKIGTSHKKRKDYQLLKKAVDEKWSWEDLLGKITKDGKILKSYQAFDIDEWEAYFISADVEEFGAIALSRALGDNQKAKAAAQVLQRQGIFPIKLPNGIRDDIKFLSAVICSVMGRLKSAASWGDKMLEEKKALKGHFESKLNKVSSPLYGLFLDFVKEVESRNEGVKRNGITKKCVLVIGKHFPKKEPKDFQVVVDILKQEKYKGLWEDFEELGFTYLAEEKYKRAREMPYYTQFDPENSPFPLVFGLTGRGYPFTIATGKNNLLFTLKFPDDVDVGLNGMPSRYFWDPVVEKDGNGFKLAFTKCNSLNPRVESVVKELAIIKTPKAYYVSVNFQYNPILIADSAKDARGYFSAALETNKEKPVDTVRVMGLDLGMNPAGAFAIIPIKGGLSNFTCPVEGFPDSAFEAMGIIGKSYSDKMLKSLCKLSNDCVVGVHYIRLSKAIRDCKEFDDKDKEFLSETISKWSIEHHLDAIERKKVVSEKVGKIVGQFKKLHTLFALRECPGPNKAERACAESFKMLLVLKNIQRLLKSWNRYDWTEKDKGREPPPNELNKYQNWYNNLRGDVEKKLIFSIVQVAKKNNIDIVACEDLAQRDRDDEVKSRSENSLMSLWGHGSLIDRLELALFVEGILLSKVDPKHTSQLSSITDEFGARDKNNKANFYFEDENYVIWRIHADINAAMNIARRFLTRYRSLTSIKGLPLPDGSYIIQNGQKRQRSFLKLFCGETQALFAPNGDHFVLRGITKKEHDALIDTAKKDSEWFYRHRGVWILRDVHKKWQASLLKQVSESGAQHLPTIES